MSLHAESAPSGTVRAPARSRPDTERVMRLGVAQMGDVDLQAVTEVVRSQILYRYHGSTVAEFERRFSSDLLDGRPALAVNSGSSALELALAALDEEPGFEVLVPALGFVSAATAVVAAGGVPRFVPVDRSLGIDVAAAAQALTPRTRALLAIHLYGAACDLTAVTALAAEHGLHVVEDVAQACGGSFGGRPLGTHGTIAAFSFQHFKLLSTGEGGLVASTDAALMDRVQCLHDAASYWTTPDAARRVDRLRMAPANLRMSELEGALGLAQLPRVPGWIARLRATKKLLAEHLADRPELQLRPLPDPAGEIGSTLAFYCPEAAFAERVTAGLRAEGVGAGPLLGPPGSNRHFVGDWAHVLRQCGAQPADEGLVNRMRALLAPGIVVALDLRYDERDLNETIEAFDRALPR